MVFTEENRQEIEERLMGMDVNFYSYATKILINCDWGTYVIKKGEVIDWGLVE